MERKMMWMLALPYFVMPSLNSPDCWEIQRSSGTSRILICDKETAEDWVFVLNRFHAERIKDSPCHDLTMVQCEDLARDLKMLWQGKSGK